MIALARAGASVLRFDAADRNTFRDLRQAVRPGVIVLHSLPTLRGPDGLFDPTPVLLDLLDHRPRRVVYLSTTGVYGKARIVDETTPPAPATERQRLRLAAEDAVATGPWSSLILRPAAIYGPGRGVHVRLREGRFKLLGDGSNFVSRIHVDDLAAITTAALLAEATGAFPVADDGPCTSREIVAVCADLLGLPMPGSAEPGELDETRRSDRRVDGRAIRRLLGVELGYPSYRQGVRAALEAQADGAT
jgi:nucleoside-diphosphate-sugar epimerase